MVYSDLEKLDALRLLADLTGLPGYTQRVEQKARDYINGKHHTKTISYAREQQVKYAGKISHGLGLGLRGRGDKQLACNAAWPCNRCSTLARRKTWA